MHANAGDARDVVLIPVREDALEKEMATHSSIFAWGNLMDRGAWQATVCGVAKSQTQHSVHTYKPIQRPSGCDVA